jgi:hypothetical protein
MQHTVRKFASVAKVEFQTSSGKTGNVHINVTMRRVHETTVAVENQKVLRIPSMCL